MTWVLPHLLRSISSCDALPLSDQHRLVSMSKANHHGMNSQIETSPQLAASMTTTQVTARGSEATVPTSRARRRGSTPGPFNFVGRLVTAFHKTTDPTPQRCADLIASIESLDATFAKLELQAFSLEHRLRKHSRV